jgi:hypothetical protein
MRKLVGIFVVVVFICVTFVTFASAEDTMIEGKIESVLSKTDKNGRPFTIVVVEEQRTLNGISYTAGVPCMAFGKLHETAQGLKEGDTLKAIASKREYNGDTSYTLRHIINQ